MNLTEMSIAYSPQSEVLDDVLRSAVSKLLIQNVEIIPNLIDLLPDSVWPDGVRPNGTITIPESIHNIASQWNITLPETISITEIPTLPPEIWPVVYRLLRRFIQVTPYSSSTELRGIYANETETRKVVAAVEFDDSLYGKFWKKCFTLLKSKARSLVSRSPSFCSCRVQNTIG